MINHLKAS